MLFNPAWTKTADNCKLTLRNFQGWVEAQNPKARYRYAYKHQCAVGCWLKATGHDRLVATDWRTNPVLDQADYIAADDTQTFGALSKRLRALAERPF